MSVGLDDLPAGATHEDIAAFVDKIMQPAEKEGEKKAEVAEKAEAASQENADKTPKTPASDETPAGDGDAAGKEKAGEDSALQGEAEDRSWLTDELKAEVAALGVDEKGLEDFHSREELDRALRFVYRDARRAGESLTKGAQKPNERQQIQEDRRGDERQRGADGRFVAEDKAPKTKPEEAGTADELDLSEFDEDLGKRVNTWAKGLRSANERQIKILEERFARLEAIENQRANRAFEESVDAAIELLDCPELYGKTGKESKAEMANRQKVMNSLRDTLIGMHARGAQMPLPTVVARIHQMEFAEHLSKKERKALTKKIADQSAMRQGGGRAKPSDPKESLEEFADRRYRELGG